MCGDISLCECISLMISHTEYLFMFLLIILMEEIFHILWYVEVILDYTWFVLNFLPSRTVCLMACQTSICFNQLKKKNAVTRLFRMSKFEGREICFPSYVTIASTTENEVFFPNTNVVLPYYVHVILSLWKPWRNVPVIFDICSLFWQDIKLWFRHPKWGQVAIVHVVLDMFLHHWKVELYELYKI